MNDENGFEIREENASMSEAENPNPYGSQRCSRCGGTGEVPNDLNDPSNIGIVRPTNKTCPKCRGTGREKKK